MLSQDYSQGKLNCLLNQILEIVWQIGLKKSRENYLIFLLFIYLFSYFFI